MSRHIHTDPQTMTDEEIQTAILELEEGLTNTQPGSHIHTQIEDAIDRMMAEVEKRAQQTP